MDTANAKKLGFPPALALFLLAPAIGELLSGSAPPVEFFSPFGFVMIVSLYGSGAVVVRELKVRWKKGIASMLLLGAAYGVLEEGLLSRFLANANIQCSLADCNAVRTNSNSSHG